MLYFYVSTQLVLHQLDTYRYLGNAGIRKQVSSRLCCCKSIQCCHHHLDWNHRKEHMCLCTCVLFPLHRRKTCTTWSGHTFIGTNLWSCVSTQQVWYQLELHTILDEFGKLRWAYHSKTILHFHQQLDCSYCTAHMYLCTCVKHPLRIDKIGTQSEIHTDTGTKLYLCASTDQSCHLLGHCKCPGVWRTNWHWQRQVTSLLFTSKRYVLYYKNLQ